MNDKLKTKIEDALAGNPETLILNNSEAKTLPPSAAKGIHLSLRTDLEKSRALVVRIAQHHTRNAARKLIGIPEHTNPQPEEAATLLAPGYFGPNAYLRNLAKRTQLPVLRHPHFDKIRLKGNLDQEAQYYFELLRERSAPTIVVAHSRGGPTVLKALKKLQDHGEDHKVKYVVLIAPISHGIRQELAPIARFIPSRTIQEMRPGHPRISDWQGLSQDNRTKIITIAAQDGDLFTSKENGYIEGGLLVVLPCNDGHLQQCLDRESLMFQTAVKVINTLEKELLT